MKLALYGAALAIAVVSFAEAKCSSHSCMQTQSLKDLEHDITYEGSDAVLVVKGTTEKEITAGTMIQVSLAVYGIDLGEKEFDFCAHLPCPFAPMSDVQFSLPLDIPTEVPAGVALDVTLKFVKGEETLGCLDGEVVVRSNALTTAFEFAEQEVSYLFKKWAAQFDVCPVENAARIGIFAENLKRIATHNAVRETWTMAMNQFGHLKPEEFKRIYASGYKPSLKRKINITRPVHVARELEELPDTVNWVEQGAVTPVKNQGACGSCWSFATTGALEGAYYLKYGKLVSFSEQELVACDSVDQGCNGGIMDSAYQWIEENKGLCSEEDYPYVAGTGKRGLCKEKRCTSVPNSAPKSFVDVAHDPADLKSAVAKGPVAVAIEADQTAFQFYSRGVLTARCGNKLDHGVLVAGYGTLDGKKYWLVKNSWGSQWGDAGYIRLERESQMDGGECGIQLSASYPSF